MTKARRHRGRVEAALDRELTDHGTAEIGPAARAAMRAQARAVDLAETAGDPELISTASTTYLSLLKANGLTGAPAVQSDPFDELLAELARPSAGARDPTEP